jgi:hypothetical protein
VREAINTYGTISSCNPLKKSIGTFVIFGIISSLRQYSWQKGVSHFATGTAFGIILAMLRKVFSRTRPLISPASWFFDTRSMATAPPMLCPKTTILLFLRSSRDRM